MPETFISREVLMDTDQANQSVSIAEAGKRLMRSPSWVKARKNDLREIWWWCQDDLFNDDGSLSGLGFKKLCELFKFTANSEIAVKRGKSVSVPKAPEMSLEEYKNLIWTSHHKFPDGKASEYLEELVDDPATDQVTDIQVYEAEYVEVDHGSEMADEFAIAKHEAQVSISDKRSALFGRVKNLRGFIKQTVKQEILGGAMEAVDEAFTEIGDLIADQVPEESTAPKVKRQRKKS